MNKYDIFSDHVELTISNKKKETNIVFIDVDDVERCKEKKWSISKSGYVHSSDGISLHRFILNYIGPLSVDHINRNKLDNRKSNLRVVDTFTNNQNNSSKGVFFDKHANKWRAEFHRYGEYYYAGIHNTEKEAINARNNLIKQLDNDRSNQLDNYKNKDLNHMTGVRPSPHGRWVAKFCADNKVYHVGTYDTKEEAVAARSAAILEHKNKTPA